MLSRSALRSGRSFFRSSSSRSRQRVSSRPYARFEPLEDRNLLAASVLTDKSDYLFGETALISGAGFTADETVQLQVLHATGTAGSNADAQNQPWLVLADTSGAVASQWSVTDPDAVDATYVLIATGLTSGFVAEANFTDSGPPSNGNLFQWDPPGWVTGNNDGPYFEGDTVPYYTNFSNLVVGDTYSITIEWDTTKSGKHALDYLRSYDATIAFPPAIDPAVEAGVNVMSTDTIPIPTDTFMTTHPTFSGVQQPGSFKMYNGDMIAVSAYNNPLTYLGDTSTSITVTFVAQDDDGDINTTTTSVVLTWGGHIATRQDWGLLNSAVNIPGSPYHMRLDSFFDVTNDEELGLGNTDRSLSAQAVIFPALITIIKDAVPDDAQVFAFTTTGTGLSTFSLDDDGDNNNALSNTRQFSVTNFDQKTITEAIVPGWELTNIQISEVGGTNDSTFNVGNRLATLNVQEGEVITVRFTNEIRRGGITVIKNAIPDGPQDFSFSGTLPVFSLDDDADPTLSNTALFSNLTPGSYTITEAQVVGWDLTNLQFVGDTDNGSLVNLATRTITVDVDPGENITVTFTNTQRGGITVIKNAIPDGPQDFSFSGTLPVFSLDDDADPTLSNTALFSNLTPGSYTITEAQVVGWDLTNLQFVGDTDNGSLVNLATRTITVDVDPGENITVTFTNTQRGGITVIKNAIPDGPQDFSFSGTLPVFSLDDDADPTLSNTALFSNLTPGSYTITEAQVVGWDLTNLQFVGDTDNGSLVNLATRTITVDVDPGENITVTFTNTQRGGITVIKNAIPDGPQDFSFSGTLPVFSLDDDNDPTLSNTALFSNLTPGSYTITEAQVVGWDLTNLQFVGDTDNGSLVNLATRTITVDVDPGENITVTFTNTQRGGITVIKNAIPDGPQDFSFSGTLPVFSLDDDADPTLSNTALFSNLTPGSYTITEAQVVGWDLTNLQFVGDTDNGSLVNLATRTITVDVDPGENITVTFTNTQRGGITVIKNAIPDGPQDFSFSGTLPVFSLDDDADPTLSNTALFSNLTPGSYTITEAQVVGWDLTNLQFVGDTDNGSLVNLATRTITVDVDPGENITVTFTNTQRGGITVIKNAIPDGPQDFSFSGTLPVFSLDDDADPTLSNTALFSNLTPGSYTITEAQVVGWDLTNLQFVGDTDNGSLVNLATRTITVDVDPGENITVTFTNTQRGGITVIKNAIPDGPQDFSFSGTLPVFSLDDDADPTLSNTALFSNLTPGSYTITEAQVVGWDLTNLQFVGDTDNGSLVNLATRTITVDVDPGENITVTFTNTQRGGITVIKNAIPDGPQDFSFSGTLPVFSLDDDNDPTLSNTALFSNLTPGSYTITEAQVVGWDLTNLQFVGDTDNGSLVNLATRTITVDVDPGENITVTFTNTQRGGITVIKNAIPDGPQDFSFSGTLPVFSLDDDANPTLSNTRVFSNLLPGSYVLNEAVVAGWNLANIVIQGDTDNGSIVNIPNRTVTIDVDPGEAIQVIFINLQEPPIVVGPDKSLGSQPVIEILNSVTGAVINTFLAYEASYIGGVRIATGDLTGDGIAEIVTAPGRNHVPLVRVFSQSGTMLTEFLAFDSGFLGGVDVAVGDVDGDGKNDIIAGQSFDGSAVRSVPQRVEPADRIPTVQERVLPVWRRVPWRRRCGSYRYGNIRQRNGRQRRVARWDCRNHRWKRGGLAFDRVGSGLHGSSRSAGPIAPAHGQRFPGRCVDGNCPREWRLNPRHHRRSRQSGRFHCRGPRWSHRSADHHVCRFYGGRYAELSGANSRCVAGFGWQRHCRQHRRRARK